MEASDSDDAHPFNDIPTRPMRVKVLYTFDPENKTTCLARFPETLNIPAVSIDEQSQVGVIELQKCIQAVISASPEILSRLEAGDFTIYAYDYSEYETPLVGQGRLSSLLTSYSTHDILPPQNKAMITGRVCQNIPALFSNGVKETLEVKLRLTPVSRPTQNEFAKTMDAFRSMSPATSAGFDPNAWNASLQQKVFHPNSNDYFGLDSLPTDGEDNSALFENFFDMDSGSSGAESGNQQSGGVGIHETPTVAAYNANPAFPAQSHSAPGSRAGSPMMGPESSTRNEQLRHYSFSGSPPSLMDQSRPESRASVRSESQSTHHQRPSAQPYQMPSEQSQAELYYNEDGQARKRARVTQTDWHGRSSFGTKSSNLRVTAATAASMHMHRPIAKRPCAPGSDLEPPPRVPTPVPRNTWLPHQRAQQAPAPRSMLRQASIAESDFMSDIEPMSDASPEENSPNDSFTAEGTPGEIPSSPPVIPGFNQPQPSSPGLPTLPPSRLIDSGYMSERGCNSSTFAGGREEDENRSPDAEDLEVASQFRPRNHRQSPFVKIEGWTATDVPPYPSDAPSANEMNVRMERPGDMDQLPQKMLLNLPHKRDGNQGLRPLQAAPPKISTDAGSPYPPNSNYRDNLGPEGPYSRRGSLVLPSKTVGAPLSQTQNSNASQFKRQPLQRSRTGNDSDYGSPAPSDTEGRPLGAARSGSGAPRRKVIEQRLHAALAKGDVPQFCSHCGAIETPTWRRLFVKYVDGKPSPLDSVEGEGEIVSVQTLEKNETTGEVTRFAIWKSMKKTKEAQPGQGFDVVMVCNPCGLWFNKFRHMRPPEKWNRKSMTRKSKKQKPDDDSNTDGIEPPSEALFTDQVVPEEAIGESPTEDESRPGQNGPVDEFSQSKQRPRANSMRNDPLRRGSGNSSSEGSQGNQAIARAMKSSPIRFQGSEDSPIELDLTPNPTRRLLFPSPRQAGEVKSLGDGLGEARDLSPSKKGSAAEKPSSSKMPSLSDHTDVNVFEAFTYDKENLEPTLADHDDLSHLFEGSPTALFRTPLRKTPSKPTPRSQRRYDPDIQTPTRESRKRKALSPSSNAANNADMRANDFMTSPSSSRYFLRSTPSRLERTPGGRSNSSGNHFGGGHEISPFSRHLAQMLSDVTHGDDAPFTSPSHQYNFSDLPSFNSPGKELDWKSLDEILSSEFGNYDEQAAVAYRKDGGSGKQSPAGGQA